MLFRKQSGSDKVLEPLAGRAPRRATLRSGLLAAGTAAGVTAMSSAVSSYRKKKQQR
jgi:hypothetical protein